MLFGETGHPTWISSYQSILSCFTCTNVAALHLNSAQCTSQSTLSLNKSEPNVCRQQDNHTSMHTTLQYEMIPPTRILQVS